MYPLSNAGPSTASSGGAVGGSVTPTPTTPGFGSVAAAALGAVTGAAAHGGANVCGWGWGCLYVPVMLCVYKSAMDAVTGAAAHAGVWECVRVCIVYG